MKDRYRESRNRERTGRGREARVTDGARTRLRAAESEEKEKEKDKYMRERGGSTGGRLLGRAPYHPSTAYGVHRVLATSHTLCQYRA
eukprot:1537272-Rhodomonas_salina.1